MDWSSIIGHLSVAIHHYSISILDGHGKSRTFKGNKKGAIKCNLISQLSSFIYCLFYLQGIMNILKEGSIWSGKKDNGTTEADGRDGHWWECIVSSVIARLLLLERKVKFPQFSSFFRMFPFFDLLVGRLPSERKRGRGRWRDATSQCF